MNREHRTEIESFMVNDVQEHYHHIPGLDGSHFCLDVMQIEGRVVTASWYSHGGIDRTGSVNFIDRVAA